MYDPAKTGSTYHKIQADKVLKKYLLNKPKIGQIEMKNKVKLAVLIAKHES